MTTLALNVKPVLHLALNASLEWSSLHQTRVLSPLARRVSSSMVVNAKVSIKMIGRL